MSSQEMLPACLFMKKSVMKGRCYLTGSKSSADEWKVQSSNDQGSFTSTIEAPSRIICRASGSNLPAHPFYSNSQKLCTSRQVHFFRCSSLIVQPGAITPELLACNVNVIMFRAQGDSRVSTMYLLGLGSSREFDPHSKIKSEAGTRVLQRTRRALYQLRYAAISE